MTKYIIIWAILQSGSLMYDNPEYHHIMADDNNLADLILEVKEKAFLVDIKVYRAEEIQWKMGTKIVDIPAQDTVVDSFKIIDSKEGD